ncbi:hypothetical protein VPHD480_0189 [Vibrio phage D480]
MTYYDVNQYELLKKDTIMTSTSIMRGANTVVRELQIFSGDTSTVVIGAPASGKNAMLLGMLAQRGAENCTFICTEMYARKAINMLPPKGLAVQSNASFESIVGAVSRATASEREFIVIEHLPSNPQFDAVDVLESIVRAHNKKLIIGMQAARDGITRDL